MSDQQRGGGQIPQIKQEGPSQSPAATPPAASQQQMVLTLINTLRKSGIQITPEMMKHVHAKVWEQQKAGGRPMHVPPPSQAQGAASSSSSPAPPMPPPPSKPSFAVPPAPPAPPAMPPPPAKRMYPFGDAAKLVSRRGLDYMMKATGLEDQGFKLDQTTEDCLMEIYDDFVTNALQFGCSNTKRRPGGASLRPSDMAVYLERTYHLTVPGFGSADAREVKPYRKIAATELHKSRQRIARETSLEEDRAMAKARKSVAASDQFVADVGGKGQAIVSVLGPQAAVPRGN